LIVEFGVEMRRERGMSIIESAKAASRERLRPILMTSFAFVMGVLPMATSTGAGAYSRNSLGIVIAFGIAVSTILGRFVIPIYYVLGERIIDHFATSRRESHPSRHSGVEHEFDDSIAPEKAIPAAVH
jgi:HAE1 family hydrophobic/amphiphilic exporter-1